MHPILERPGRLLAWLVAWAPVILLLSILVRLGGALSWLETLALLAPLGLLYSFMCLSAFYLCRAFPPQSTRWLLLGVTHATAAGAASTIWIVAAALAAWLYTRAGVFPNLDERFGNQLPLLFASGCLLHLLATAFHYVLAAHDARLASETRAVEARGYARDAELKAIKAQLQPHFLFNSLNSISALTTAEPAAAREMCLRLAGFLRATLGVADRRLIPLSEELALIHDYIAIEQVRLGPRLRYQQAAAPGCAGWPIPPLLLQPLVENAVVHGIAELLDGGEIRLTAACDGGALRLELENDIDPEAAPRRRGGRGLAIVRERLDATYPRGAACETARAGDRFRVTLRIPNPPEARP
jgi:hypothetical protein